MNFTVCVDHSEYMISIRFVKCDLTDAGFTFRSGFFPNGFCFHFIVDGSDKVMQMHLLNNTQRYTL